MTACNTVGCLHEASTHGSGHYLRTDTCLPCFATWYAATVQQEDRERLAVLPTVPASHLNKKVGEGTCKYCREAIWWRQREPQPGQERGKPYPAQATGDTDRGHRCHGRTEQQELAP